MASSPTSTPRLRIDTTAIDESYFDVDLSQARVSNEISNPHFLSADATGRENKTLGGSSRTKRSAGRASSESGVQRLLKETLQDLRQRPKGPDIYADSASRLKNNITDKVVPSRPLPSKPPVLSRQPTSTLLEPDDPGDIAPTGFSSESAFDKVAQLINVLEAELKTHDKRAPTERVSSDGLAAPSHKLRRSSFERRPSPSPLSGASDHSVFEQLLSLLTELVQDDSRFSIVDFRLSKPPYALQAALLKLGSYMLAQHGHNPERLMSIGLAMLPALHTFPGAMQERLFIFFSHEVLTRICMLIDQGRTIPVLAEAATNVFQEHDASGVSVAINVFHDEDDGNYPESYRDSNKHNESRTLPGLQPGSYHVSALVQPLLATFLDTFHSWSSADHRVPIAASLFIRLMAVKPDLQSDLMSIVAYRHGLVRRRAASVILELWPHAIGHQSEADELRGFINPDSVSHQHHFCGWYFGPLEDKGRVFPQHVINRCNVCLSTIIEDYGLFCSSCTCAVHLQCYDYPLGCHDASITATDDAHSRKIALHRYCELLSRNNPLQPKKTATQERHSFTTVNIFTLTVCLLCRMPIWSPEESAVKCRTCHRFAHSSCSQTTNSATIVDCDLSLPEPPISWADLRASFMKTFRDLVLTPSNVMDKSFEEISLIRSIFWLQNQALEHGINMSALHITGDRTPFELHRTLEICQAYSTPEMAFLSPGMDRYIAEIPHLLPSWSLWFTWPFLTYLVSSLKSPAQTTHQDAHDMSFTISIDDSVDDAPDVSYDSISMDYGYHILAYDFHIHSKAIAYMLISRLDLLGILQLADIDDIPSSNEGVRLDFPVASATDRAHDVESLFAAIEGCLRELDLSLNEFAFLLLVRKAWPSAISTSYALNRLATAVVRWILSEEECLLLLGPVPIVIPGLRSKSAPKPWPHRSKQEMHGNISEYRQCRQSMMSRYALPWLLALYDLHPDTYADVLFKSFEDIAQDSGVMDDDFDQNSQATVTLELLVAPTISLAMFDIHNEMFLHWLRNHVSNSSQKMKFSLPALQKWFAKDDAGRRSTVLALQSTPTGANLQDPWDSFTRAGAVENMGADVYVRCIRAICRAGPGIECPLEVCSQISAAVAALSGDKIELHSIFADILLHTSFSRNVSVSKLSDHLYRNCIAVGTLNEGEPSTFLASLRPTLAAILVLIGSERSQIIFSGVIDESEMPNAMRKQVRGVPTNNIGLSNGFLTTLRMYIEQRNDEVSQLILRFLELYLCQSTEVPWMDHWIASHSSVLTHCAWLLYHMRSPGLAHLQLRVMCRILHVEATQFRELLTNAFDSHAPWQDQVEALSQLQRIAIDLVDPSLRLSQDVVLWRHQSLDVFEYFFKALWSTQSDIRQTASSMASSLLVSHLEAITQFWAEVLPQTNILRRLAAISFMLQLRSHFPQWQLLSWDCLFLLLRDSGFQPFQAGASSLAQTDPIQMQLHSATLLLMLQLIASGRKISYAHVQTFKLELARFIGFRETAPKYKQLDTILEYALPCIEELVLALDAHTDLDLVMAEGNTQRPVGIAFVDILLAIINETPNILQYPLIALQNLVSGMLIILQKYHMEDQTLEFLQQDLRQAMRRLAPLLADTSMSELQQAAFAVWQGSLYRCGFMMTSSLLEFYLENLSMNIATALLNNDSAYMKQLAGLGALIIRRHPTSGVLKTLLRQCTITNMKAIEVIITTPEQNIMSLRDVVVYECSRKLLGASDTELNATLQAFGLFLEHFDKMDYSDNVLRALASQAVSLSGRLNAQNPIVTVGSLVKIIQRLVNYPALSQDMWSALDAVLAIGLLTCVVSSEELADVADILKRAARVQEYNTDAGRVALLVTLRSTLADGLYGKKPVMPGTIVSLISMTNVLQDSMISDGPQAIANGLSYMVNSRRSQAPLKPSVADLLSVAKWILDWAQPYPQVLKECLNMVVRTDLRSWNALLLSALSHSDLSSAGIILDHYADFAIQYASLLKNHSANPMTPHDLKHAFIAIRGWISLISMLKSTGVGGTEADHTTTGLRIWHELWPPLDALCELTVRLNDRSIEGTSMILAIKPAKADLISFAAQNQTLLLDLGARMELADKTMSSLPSTSLRQMISRTLTQFNDQEKMDIAESRLTQQGASTR